MRASSFHKGRSICKYIQKINPGIYKLFCEPLTYIGMDDGLGLSTAIWTNSPSLVRAYLLSGNDPNLPIQAETSKMLMMKPIKGLVPPLHQAVLNCFERSKREFHSFDKDDKIWRPSKQILNSLLEFSANPNQTAVFGLGEQDNFNGDALDFAASLKSKLTKHCEKFQITSMEIVIGSLIKAGRSLHSEISLTTVPESTRLLWSTMNSEGYFKDFIFDASGETIYAHRCILNAASPFFARFLAGDQSDCVRIQCTRPAAVIRAVLGFMYTGSLNPAVLKV